MSTRVQRFIILERKDKIAGAGLGRVQLGEEVADVVRPASLLPGHETKQPKRRGKGRWRMRRAQRRGGRGGVSGEEGAKGIREEGIRGGGEEEKGVMVEEEGREEEKRRWLHNVCMCHHIH